MRASKGFVKTCVKCSVCHTTERPLLTECSVTWWNSHTSRWRNLFFFFQSSYSFSCRMKPDFFLFSRKTRKSSRHWNWGQNNLVIIWIWYQIWRVLPDFFSMWLLHFAGMFSCPLNVERPTPDDLTNTSVLEWFSPVKQLEILFYLWPKVSESLKWEVGSHFPPQLFSVLIWK